MREKLAEGFFDDREIEALLAFLRSLTSPSAGSLAHLVPESVPSGLALIDPAPQP
jgi:hypothetical protein